MTAQPPQRTFRHEALFYRGEEGFLDGVVPFIRDALWGDEAVLVAVDQWKIRAIKASLNGEKEHLVQFADMEALGRNPGCLIPAWRDFVEEHGSRGRPIRGVGEPIWPERTAAELVECHHHESLLNLAFADTPDFWLLCPYDASAMSPAVAEHARRTHPFIAEHDGHWASDAYVPPGVGPGPLDTPLPEPRAAPVELRFTREDLREARRYVSDRAEEAGLSGDRRSDLVLAVSEVATNSVIHGGGGGVLRVWREDSAFVCEVRDEGRFDEPLVGRRRPSAARDSGRGLWLVNHLCDLVQLRSLETGNVARLHMSLS